jgi:hypothetical protein
LYEQRGFVIETKTVRIDNTVFAKKTAVAKLKSKQTQAGKNNLIDDRCFIIILALLTVARFIYFSLFSNLINKRLVSLQKLKTLTS